MISVCGGRLVGGFGLGGAVVHGVDHPTTPVLRRPRADVLEWYPTANEEGYHTERDQSTGE